MEPKRLRGYGTVEESDAKAIDSIVAELNAALEQLSAYLAKGSDLDLQARLEKLEQTRDEVRLLRELERVITAHGLVEFRTALALLLARLEHPTFEIGVFGRVSSGKSSLLNHVLGAEVLPVGVTPVTAVPMRLQFGREPRARIKFAQSQPVQIELSALAEYSTEQQNPANAKHVTEILVEVASERLRQGVTFVDTPGLGSLATAGAAETMAYLPRCDLGLVLVDAASTLTHEDLVIVQALYQSGAKAMVLLSKSDLLRPEDRQRAISYAQGKLVSELGIHGDVFPVSVVGVEATLCDTWFNSELLPLLNTHREETATSLKRKIGNLRDALVQTLEMRLQATKGETQATAQQSANEALAQLRKTDGLFETTERDAEAIIDRIPELSDPIIDAAAEDLTRFWASAPGETVASADIINSAFGRAVQNETSRLVEAFEQLRQQLDRTLIQIQSAVGKPDSAREPLPKAIGLPVPDGMGTFAQEQFTRPKLHFLGGSFTTTQARRELNDRLNGNLCSLLNEYRQRLRQWTRAQLVEMRTAFNDRSAALRVRLEAAIVPSGRAANLEALISDLQCLQA